MERREISKTSLQGIFSCLNLPYPWLFLSPSISTNSLNMSCFTITDSRPRLWSVSLLPSVEWIRIERAQPSSVKHRSTTVILLHIGLGSSSALVEKGIEFLVLRRNQEVLSLFGAFRTIISVYDRTATPASCSNNCSPERSQKILQRNYAEYPYPVGIQRKGRKEKSRDSLFVSLFSRNLRQQRVTVHSPFFPLLTSFCSVSSLAASTSSGSKMSSASGLSRRLLDSGPRSVDPPLGSANGTHGESYTGQASFDNNMVIILAALLCALICALGLNSIVRCALRCGRRFGPETSDQAGSRLATTGLKKHALRRIPVAVYGKAEGTLSATECPICLGEFVDGEKVRVLPKCNHGFHVRCIDEWLASHSSCPNCRLSLLEPPPPPPRDRPGPVHAVVVVNN